MSRIRWGALVLAATLLAGCGGNAEDDVLSATAKSLARLDRATLDLRLTATSAALDGREVGFTVTGPFDLAGGSSLPIARLTVTPLGRKAPPVTVLSTGAAAYVEKSGLAYRLPDDIADDIALHGEDGGAPGVSGLDIESWFEQPTVTRDGDTDVVRGSLDVAQALADLIEVSAGFGADGTTGLPQLNGQDRAALAKTAKGATATAVTGHDDHVLRSLTATIPLGRPAGDLSEPLRRLLPVTFALHLTLSDVGEAVTVTEPTDVRPYSELPRS